MEVVLPGMRKSELAGASTGSDGRLEYADTFSGLFIIIQHIVVQATSQTNLGARNARDM